MSMYPDIFAGLEGMEELGRVFTIVLGIYLVILLIASIYSIVVYILHSVGMYSIAKRRGIHNPWLAWLPVANAWVLGSISDHYQYVAKGKNTNRRKILLGLCIATYVLAYAVLIGTVVMVVDMVSNMGGDPMTSALSSIAVIYIGEMIMLVVAIVQTVFMYIAYNDLFNSSKPGNATAFLVLGILFNFLLPYFVFACRKKDDGLPVRQAPVEPQGVQYIPAPEAAAEPETPAAVEYVPTPEAADAPAAAEEPVAAEEDFEPENKE